MDDPDMRLRRILKAVIDTLLWMALLIALLAFLLGRKRPRR